MKTLITPEYLDSQGLSETFPERFWKKVKKTETCWLWTACTLNGYGRIGKGKKGSGLITATRGSWILHRGPIPDGLGVLHNCPGGDNSSCVNPDHLWLGNQKDNMQDASMKGILNVPHPTFDQWGEKNRMVKLTFEQVKEIRKKYPASRICDLAAFYSISRPVVCDIVHGKTRLFA